MKAIEMPRVKGFNSMRNYENRNVEIELYKLAPCAVMDSYFSFLTLDISHSLNKLTL